MPTFGELTTKIQNKTELNFNSTQVGEAINDAVSYYSSKEFWFNEDQATMTCTTGNPLLTTGFPADFYALREPNAVVLLNSGGQVKYLIQKLTGMEYDAMDQQAQGVPQFYLYRDGNLYLYPYPDDTYTVYLNYTKGYAVMTDSADTNDFTEYADRLIQANAIANLYRDYRHSPQDAAIYDQVAKDELRQILQQTDQRLVTGRLTTENIVADDYGPRWFWRGWG